MSNKQKRVEKRIAQRKEAAKIAAAKVARNHFINAPKSGKKKT